MKICDEIMQQKHKQNNLYMFQGIIMCDEVNFVKS